MARTHAKSKRQKTGSASLERWDKAADIPLDAQEQFHEQRDRILLEGEDDADDDFAEDDEVFALRGVGDDGDSDSDAASPSASDDEPQPTTKSKSKSAAKKKTLKSKSAQQSDDDSADSDSEDEGWGRKKSAYYADDDVGSDDGEAAELQEAEVRRVQAKARAALTDDDFGLADLRIADSAASPTDTDPDAVTLAPPLDLARQSPETLALAREWDDVAQAVLRAERAVEKTQQADPDALSLGLLHVHHQTLLTYATTLAFYFRLRTAERYTSRPALLREHPILRRLLVLKQALSTLEDLDFGGDSDSEDLSSEPSDDLSTDADLDEDEDVDLDADDGWKQLELAELLADSTKYGNTDDDDDDDGEGVAPHKRKRRVAVKPAAPPPPSLQLASKSKSKKQSKKKAKNADAKQVFDLVEPAFVASRAPKLATVSETDEFGDPLAMQAADAADKKARRHTLRFHAAKIESASARRKGKRVEMGGDEDVPYPERRKDKERRLAEELERRRAKLGLGGEDLDGQDDEDSGAAQTKRKRRREEEEDGMEVEGDQDADGYYELVAGARKAAKKAKKEQYDAERAAERVVDDDDGSQDGPRALTRAILKNKGLTPHRAKSVRNPRVKKRLRYEKAQKRVASQRAVFKGGLAGSKGVYEGERSGINPRVVKSTKLG